MTLRASVVSLLVFAALFIGLSKCDSVGEKIGAAANTVSEGAKKAWDSTSKFFTEKYTSLSNLIVTNRADIDSTINNTINYLSGLHDRKDELIKAAQNQSNAKAENAANELQSWTDELKQLQSDAKSGLDDKTYASKWQEWITDKWNNGGLEQLLAVAKKLSSGALANTLSMLTLILSFGVLIQMAT